ncbi:sarcosine oxidase subunit gamma family protein [Fulvimarina sp. 2208YS6-2-32]|uniref:Sarcosine oxidase subunit gamma family protein n=1 Tax=Fulvimarina uroteuthidis TaxID=3098149 RepID=A0ABU5I3Q2_9HYPH|nr:sarcosine oxidase subunit gamma family protein [Fulvimarina sp. 2208YS6-2-32]MDY8110014.1 sarcosine oxidase subunit gamma family protein [Fulvimarina sp. 2208YS6-2-32]
MLEVNLAQRVPAVRFEEAGLIGPLRVSLQPSIGRLSFRARAAALGGRREVAGFPVDGAVNTRSDKGDRVALRLGPDEWMLLCNDEETDTAVEAVLEAMAGKAHSLVDVSHRDVTFEVRGAMGDAVINSGCPLDLSPAAFPAGTATRTLFGKAEIVLARISDTTWQITCWRSFGAYVQGYLVEAARDFADA